MAFLRSTPVTTTPAPAEHLTPGSPDLTPGSPDGETPLLLFQDPQMPLTACSVEPLTAVSLNYDCCLQRPTSRSQPWPSRWQLLRR